MGRFEWEGGRLYCMAEFAGPCWSSLVLKVRYGVQAWVGSSLKVHGRAEDGSWLFARPVCVRFLVAAAAPRLLSPPQLGFFPLLILQQPLQEIALGGRLRKCDLGRQERAGDLPLLPRSQKHPERTSGSSPSKATP